MNERIDFEGKEMIVFEIHVALVLAQKRKNFSALEKASKKFDKFRSTNYSIQANVRSYQKPTTFIPTYNLFLKQFCSRDLGELKRGQTK